MIIGMYVCVSSLIIIEIIMIHMALMMKSHGNIYCKNIDNNFHNTKDD